MKSDISSYVDFIYLYSYSVN